MKGQIINHHYTMSKAVKRERVTMSCDFIVHTWCKFKEINDYFLCGICVINVTVTVWIFSLSVHRTRSDSDAILNIFCVHSQDGVYLQDRFWHWHHTNVNCSCPSTGWGLPSNPNCHGPVVISVTKNIWGDRPGSHVNWRPTVMLQLLSWLCFERNMFQ